MLIPIRLRLVIAPALVVLASLVALAAFEIRDARGRIEAETSSGLQLARLLIESALARTAVETDPALAITRLESDLPPTVRHVVIRVERSGSSAGESPAPPPAAPAWFVRIVSDPPVVQRFPIMVGPMRYGQVVLSGSPSDEIVETWRGWRNQMAVLALVSAAIIAVVLAALGLALRPLTRLSEALDRLEGGDFAVRAPVSSDPQLKRLAGRFNRLAASLEQVNADNRMLIDRLMSVQEAERKEIASELHDEIGPSLFAIRADLGALSRMTRQPDASPEEMRERLTSISTLVTQIQRINSRLLEQLRPVILDQLPLGQAIERLVDGWRGRFPDMTWSAAVDPAMDLSDARSQAIYRTAQEAMTNVIRHANATGVELALSRQDGRVRLRISDNGSGFPQTGRLGLGLLGMNERAKALGGKLILSKSPLGGANIVLELPEAEEVE